MKAKTNAADYRRARNRIIAGAKSDYRGEMGLSQRERDYRNAETVCRTS
jgi:hypothetical protein